MLVVQTSTLNEAGTIQQLLEQIRFVVPDAHILVIDDNSPDGTGKITSKFALDDNAVHLIERIGRRGLGSAILEGIKASESLGADIVVYMDADFSHSPHDIPRLLQALDGSHEQQFDIAIGSRRIPGGKIVGWSWRRHLASFLVNWFSRFLLCVPVYDSSSGFRAVRLRALRDVDFTNIAEGYAFQEDFLWRAHRAGARIIEVPITFTNRDIGKSKVNAKELISSALRLLKIACRTWLHV